MHWLNFVVVVVASILFCLGGSHGRKRMSISKHMPTFDANARQNFYQLLDNTDELVNGFPKKPDINIGTSDNPGDVKFYIYSNPRNPDEFDEIPFEERAAANHLWGQRKFDPSKEWKFLIHGFLQSQNSSMPNLIVKEYLKRWCRTGERVNIVVVDWGRLAGDIGETAAFPSYSKAVQNVAVAGIRVGEMIHYLKRLQMPSREGNYVTPIMDLEKVHIIGFSLGAHVAGVAGDYVFRTLSRKVGRITGLDPAGPFFYDGLVQTGRTLTKQDANSLDVIHTNWDEFGIDADIGDIDFHPNGGMNVNPLYGILGSQIQSWCKSKWYFFMQPMTLAVCSHNLAPIYYAFSINHKGSMNACRCGSWLSYTTFCPCTYKQEMGEYWNPVRGNLGPFYIKISAESFDRDEPKLDATEENCVPGLFNPFEY